MNVIRSQQGARGTVYDAEYGNKTSFYFDRTTMTCRQRTFEVGILRQDWLSDAKYLGTRTINNFTVHAFTKADFIDYFEDTATGRPVRWRFYQMAGQFEVMSWDVGSQALAPASEWQAPPYCFAKGLLAAEAVDEQQHVQQTEVMTSESAPAMVSEASSFLQAARLAASSTTMGRQH